MKRISRVCCALSVCATAAVVTGCGGAAQLPSPMAQTPFGNTSTVDRVASSSGTAKDAERTRYTKTILYSFRSGNDGIGPSGRLLDEGGTFYGETAGGGGSSGCYNPGSRVRHNLQVDAFRKKVRGDYSLSIRGPERKRRSGSVWRRCVQKRCTLWYDQFWR